MRKQRLLIWMTCLLLGGVSGCNSKHSPVSGTVDGNGNGHNGRTGSVLVDEGGTLTIEAPPGTPPDTIFTIESSLNGTSTPICSNSSNPITSKLTFTCTVVNQDGDYTVTVTEQSKVPGHPKPVGPPTTFTAYIRQCNNCK